mgnify:CR=1 FL=1
MQVRGTLRSTPSEPGMTGMPAALIAARHDRQAVIAADLDAALDRVVLGTERPLLIGPREREVIAYHEAGHALVAHHIPGADPVRKISIVAIVVVVATSSPRAFFASIFEVPTATLIEPLG